jgi:BioD-like phosphotransacetylase family protein
MRTLVIGSSCKSSGKTGIIVGLAAALGKKAGYMKPFGDRLIYHKKRLWDYDSALMTRLWNLQENPEDISIGFEHAKLKYKYDAAATVEKLRELASHCGSGKDILFVEGGAHLEYGISVNLDAVSVARALDGELVIVVSGSEGAVADDLVSIKKNLDLKGVKFKGVLVNKVHDPEDFKAVYLPSIVQLGIPVLGIIPYRPQLEHFTMGYLSEILFSKTLAGEGGLKNEVGHIVIGAMSVGSTLRETLFTKEKKLVITSGDRTDMILASLEEGTAGVILTNNILPPPNVISRAAEKNIPLLLVSTDTFKTAKQLDEMEPLLTKDDPDKAGIFTRLVKENVDLNKL